MSMLSPLPAAAERHDVLLGLFIFPDLDLALRNSRSEIQDRHREPQIFATTSGKHMGKSTDDLEPHRLGNKQLDIRHPDSPHNRRNNAPDRGGKAILSGKLTSNIGGKPASSTKNLAGAA